MSEAQDTSKALTDDERQRTNDLTQKQMEEIFEKEISTNPLIGRVEQGFATLRHEYANNDLFLQKVADLEKRYVRFRRVRGDGSCFFRSFVYTLLEAMIDNKMGDAERSRIADVVRKSRDQLISVGYDSIILDDFHEPLQERFDGAASGKLTHQQLFNDFSNTELSNCMMVYVRMLISCELKTKPFFYEPFIEPLTIQDFCNREVEPINKEADQIQIIALCNCLEVGIQIEYLDLSETGGAVNSHKFYEDKQPLLFLLYRPGHYDCLYK